MIVIFLIILLLLLLYADYYYSNDESIFEGFLIDQNPRVDDDDDDGSDDERGTSQDTSQDTSRYTSRSRDTSALHQFYGNDPVLIEKHDKAREEIVLEELRQNDPDVIFANELEEGFIKKILKPLNKIPNKVTSGITKVVRDAIGGVTSVVRQVEKNLEGVVNGAVKQMENIFKETLGTVKDAIMKELGRITKVFTTLINNLTKLVNEVAAKLTKLLNDMLKRLLGALRIIYSYIMKIVGILTRFVTFIGDVFLFIGSYIYCGLNKITTFPLCWYWYAAQLAGYVLYLPITIIVWFFSLEAIEKDIWNALELLDKFVYKLTKKTTPAGKTLLNPYDVSILHEYKTVKKAKTTGYHIIHFPDHVIDRCYLCKNLVKMPKLKL